MNRTTTNCTKPLKNVFIDTYRDRLLFSVLSFGFLVLKYFAKKLEHNCIYIVLGRSTKIKIKLGIFFLCFYGSFMCFNLCSAKKFLASKNHAFLGHTAYDVLVSLD